MKKMIAIFLWVIMTAIILSGCSYRNKNIKIIDMGISLKMPKDFLVIYNNQKTFDYNGKKVPSLSIYALSNKDKTNINIKTFPFPASDYMQHYRSAFKSTNIKEIKYDYKPVKVSKNSPLKTLHKSKATISTDDGDKTSYSYVISFKNRNGTLVVQMTGNQSSKINSIINSIRLLKPINPKINSTGVKQKYSDLKSIHLYKDINLKVPNNFEIKERPSPIVEAMYYNLFGNKNDALYIYVSTIKPIPIVKSKWSMANATEVVKFLDSEKDIETFIIHNINNSHFYYLNSLTKEFTLQNGEKVYVRLDYTDKNNDKDFARKVFESITIKQ
ncbi:hypothetical protein [Alkaliphilus sp. B6464]|uniref:hypothetical protein n=1 Tax=Alkaliphilus sp. B6464 TaxID=2731219 RepID=UPI001BAD4934|nr:hypothetical protein [Alkaliphilus sp. B6464]QUH22093.1 hypothetical protein HYG84_19495 [Alkaliphilus sp. B6464]